MKAAVVIPTLNAGSLWENWITSVHATGFSANNVYVIDSGSDDETLSMAVLAGFNVSVIEKADFNHGATRQQVINCLGDCELVILMTQDAILSDNGVFDALLSPFEDDQVGAVCGRQLPHSGATAIEAHARLYNYPAGSSLRSFDDRSIFGLKTAFISNSFAAYRVSSLSKVGGFPEDVIFGEDMYVATKLLKAGYKIAYAVDACVYHSHDYSIIQEFNRYFDMGVFHAREPWIRAELGSAEGEGLKFVLSEFRYVVKHSIWRVPELFLRIPLRYLGFRLGLLEKYLPKWLKVKLAMNKAYFKL